MDILYTNRIIIFRYNAELEEATFSSTAKVILVDVVQPFNFTYTLYNKMLEETKEIFLTFEKRG